MKKVVLMDCTLRDGANVVGKGFSAEITEMGMARSAGNLATEICVAIMNRYDQMMETDLYQMLDFIEQRLQPAMAGYDYHNPVTPLDLTLGLSGCHSSFVKRFREISEEMDVNLFRLIVEVSKQDQKAPSEEMIRTIAAQIKGGA